jgi:pyruvate-ferredoxin/flavodoxin oxidoreductase
VDRKQQLSRLLVDRTMVESAEERRDFWVMLRALAGGGKPPEGTREEIEAEVRRDVVARLASGLMQLAGGEGGAAPALAALAAPDATPGGATAPAAGSQAPAAEGAGAPAGAADAMAPWIDSAECTACDECVNLAPEIFAYGPDHKAFIKNPDGGPYSLLVKAAERCTARVIHPGLPKDRSEKDIDKWIRRAGKYN